MLKLKYSRIIIIGSGPSGCTSSIYVCRSNLKPIVLTGRNVGGQLNNTYSLENWPGIINIKGSDFTFNMINQLKKFNIEIYFDFIYNVNFLNKPFILIGEKFFYYSIFLTISTGCYYNIFNVRFQLKYIGKNISNCAICDGNLYKNKKICIIGGGESFFENLFYLKNLISFKILFIRNKFFKSNFSLIKKFFSIINNNFFIKLNIFLIEILGDDFKIIYIKIKNFFNFKINIIYIDGLFIFIGNISNSKIFLGQLKIKKNFLLTKKYQLYNQNIASINYIFVSGDVQDYIYKQAITSSASGCVVYFNLIKYYNKFYN
ncbi:thioredoxin-disulfide reductase [Candidatus Nasuia deltocephalinicola]|uniref:thioredoxin-disulfide reductase n=1 Tax=Candidatus Nasuia deltocephalincola TaxID=1160784 RepID=UPI00216B5CE9|nr:thioredoxin-disulfide reductase [Candidatus Nasuia deltocephalinicola]